MKPSCLRTLQYLRAHEGGWVQGLNLAQPSIGGLRFGARLDELKAMGYVIESRPDPSGTSRVWQYRLVEDETVPAGQLRLDVA